MIFFIIINAKTKNQNFNCNSNPKKIHPMNLTIIKRKLAILDEIRIQCISKIVKNNYSQKKKYHNFHFPLEINFRNSHIKCKGRFFNKKQHSLKCFLPNPYKTFRNHTIPQIIPNRFNSQVKNRLIKSKPRKFRKH